VARCTVQREKCFSFSNRIDTDVVSRGRLALDTSIVVVWRKEDKKERADISTVYNEILAVAKRREGRKMY
jgi:putative DNA methylase